MNPERYQQLIAKAQEASAANAIHHSEEDAKTNETKDEASPAPSQDIPLAQDASFFHAYSQAKNKKKMAVEAAKRTAENNHVEDDRKQDGDGKMPDLVDDTVPPTSFARQAGKMVAEKRRTNTDGEDGYKRTAAFDDDELASVVPPPPSAQASETMTPSVVPKTRHTTNAEALSAPTSAQTSSSGATVVSNPFSAESENPLSPLRQPSVKIYVTDAILVDPSASTAVPPAPITPPYDPLGDALEMVGRLISMYLELGPATVSLSLLQNTLAAAVVCCDDATDGPPADPPPAEEAPLGDALKFLAEVTQMYREFGRKATLVPVVREALTKAMARCEKTAGAAPVASAGSVAPAPHNLAPEPLPPVVVLQTESIGIFQSERKQFCISHQKKKKLLILFISVCVIVAVGLGFVLSNNWFKNADSNAEPTHFLMAKPTPSPSSGRTPLPSSGLTFSPSAKPTTAPFKPLPSFDNAALKTAVNEWTENHVDAEKAYGSIAKWPTSEVTTFNNLFFQKQNFTEDLVGWETGKITDMEWMFGYASSFNGDLSSFDTSRVTSMSWTFLFATSFNGDVSSFDTSSVTSMAYMFQAATFFNRDVSSFDTGRVTNMYAMFTDTTSFNQCLEWDLANGVDTIRMFEGSDGKISSVC